MKDLASEFQSVSQIYLQLGDELAGIRVDDSADSLAYLESISNKRDCLVKMQTTNARALQLSNEWKKCRPRLDAKTRSQIEWLTEELRLRAIRLYQLCDIHAQAVTTAQAKLAKSRADLGKGARYLQSIKPVKNNYPKFIDSLY